MDALARIMNGEDYVVLEVWHDWFSGCTVYRVEFV